MKTAIVTGSNRGIGLQIAQKIGKTEGYQCVIACRDAEAGAALEEALINDNCRAKFYKLDISNPESVTEFAMEMKQDYGTIDILINNAAIGPRSKDLQGMNFAQQVRRTMEVNYFGTASLCDAVGPLMAQYGRIVNVSSQAGDINLFSPRDAYEEMWEFALGGRPSLKTRFRAKDLMRDELDALMGKYIEDAGKGEHTSQGWPNVFYAVSKFGLKVLTRLMAADPFLTDRNVTVNCCCPGPCRTELSGNKGERSAEEGAERVVWLSLLDWLDDDPALASVAQITGQFWVDKKVVDWTKDR